MNLFSSKQLYMEACLKSKELHVISDSERLALQEHLRLMYKEIEIVCTRHGLTVMLAYGSVIGALRHQGFIPWDDDIDLFMPRKDYDKLINDFAEELPANYKVFAPNSKNGPIYRFAKIVDTNTRFITPGADRNSEKKGIFVDIFPLEYAPSSKCAIRLQQFKANCLMYIATSVVHFKSNNSILKKIMCASTAGVFNYYFRKAIGLLFCWYSPEEWYNIFDKSVRYRSESEFFNVPSAGPNNRYFTPLHKSMFIPTKRVIFDDIEAFIPNKSSELLEIEYGNWKEIPPENKRWKHFIEEIKFSAI